MENKNNLFIIKENMKFIYDNSGIILTKLLNINTFENTHFLLENFIFLSDETVQNELINNNDLYSEYNDCYNSAINIIFNMCHKINNSDKTKEEKDNLKNTLRIYTRHLKEDGISNKQKNILGINFSYEQYDEINKQMDKTYKKVK